MYVGPESRAGRADGLVWCGGCAGLQEERKIVYSINDQYGRKEYIGPIINGKRHGTGTCVTRKRSLTVRAVQSRVLTCRRCWDWWTGAGVLIYHNNDRCEALFENGALVEPTRFVRHEQEHSGGGRRHGKGSAGASGSGKKPKVGKRRWRRMAGRASSR